MGCDIHGWVEIKDPDSGNWVGVNDLSPWSNGRRDEYDWDIHEPYPTQRDYALFAALAGVRGDGGVPLGLPDDISESTRTAVGSWGEDGHSHTHISMADARELWGGYSAGSCPAFISFFVVEPVMQKLVEQHEDEARLVVWFDN